MRWPVSSILSLSWAMWTLSVERKIGTPRSSMIAGPAMPLGPARLMMSNSRVFIGDSATPSRVVGIGWPQCGQHGVNDIGLPRTRVAPPRLTAHCRAQHCASRDVSRCLRCVGMARERRTAERQVGEVAERVADLVERFL